VSEKPVAENAMMERFNEKTTEKKPTPKRISIFNY